jgi:hypothetical protein
MDISSKILSLKSFAGSLIAFIFNDCFCVLLSLVAFIRGVISKKDERCNYTLTETGGIR